MTEQQPNYVWSLKKYRFTPGERATIPPMVYYFAGPDVEIRSTTSRIEAERELARLHELDVIVLEEIPPIHKKDQREYGALQSHLLGGYLVDGLGEPE